MNKTIIGSIVVIIVAGGAYYFVTGKSSNVVTIPSGTTETPVVPASNTSQTSDVMVNIQNFSFSPSSLSIKTGTKVTWTNNDSVAHTVTSDSGGLLNSPTLAPGQSFSFTFASPETVAYHCAIHPSMKGTVSVTN